MSDDVKDCDCKKEPPKEIEDEPILFQIEDRLNKILWGFFMAAKPMTFSNSQEKEAQPTNVVVFNQGDFEDLYSALEVVHASLVKQSC